MAYYFVKEEIRKFSYSNTFYYRQVQGHLSVAVNYYAYCVIYLIALSAR